jgi:hypothetical protein
MIKAVRDPLRGRALVFLKYETVAGEKFLTVSQEKAQALDLFDACITQSPVSIAALRRPHGPA